MPANQMKTLTQEQFVTEAKRRFGPDYLNWKFVCPACGTVQSIRQLKDAVVSSGGTPADVEGYIGFSCIGRFTKQGDAGISAHHKGQSWNKGCNWTLGGLFTIHTMEVEIEGRKRPCFEFADHENQT